MAILSSLELLGQDTSLESLDNVHLLDLDIKKLAYLVMKYFPVPVSIFHSPSVSLQGKYSPYGTIEYYITLL